MLTLHQCPERFKSDTAAEGIVYTTDDLRRLSAFDLFALDLPMTTQYTAREVIENKLLTALQDEDTAAILVSENDLSVMIRALEYAMLADREQTRKARELAKDYRKLLKAAFPGANNSLASQSP